MKDSKLIRAPFAAPSRAGTYISFSDVTRLFSPRKTRVWAVVPRRQRFELGHIRWYPPWRCYCFFPSPNTVYEEHCLHDIASFCEARTSEHRAVLRLKTASATL